LPLGPSEIRQVAHFSHNLGNGVQRVPVSEHSKKEIKITDRVLPRSLEDLDSTPVDGADGEKYQEVGIDQ
jgi:hypothetical protein